MKFVIELDDFACSAAERQVMRWGFDVQGIGGRAMRILRNTNCPWTILSVYAQHLSAGRSGLPLLSGGHDCSGRRRGCVLDVYGRVSFEKGECVDILDFCSGRATSAGG